MTYFDVRRTRKALVISTALAVSLVSVLAQSYTGAQIELQGSDSTFVTPATVQMKITGTGQPFFSGSNGKPERGWPLFSSQVEQGALFYTCNIVIAFPPRRSAAAPVPNRLGGSSFIAVKHLPGGKSKKWLCASMGAANTLGINWEYQIRWYSGDPETGEGQFLLIGTVPNADVFDGEPFAGGYKVELQEVLPDLVGDIGDRQSFPGGYGPGASGSLSLLLSNAAPVAASGKLIVDFHFSTNETFEASQDERLAQAVIDPFHLAGGDTITVPSGQMTITNSAATNDYFFLARINPDKLIPETEFTNNLVVTRPALADLSLRIAGHSLNSTRPAETGTVDVVLHWAGSDPAPSGSALVQMVLYSSRDFGWAMPLGTVSAPLEEIPANSGSLPLRIPVALPQDFIPSRTTEETFWVQAVLTVTPVEADQDPVNNRDQSSTFWIPGFKVQGHAVTANGAPIVGAQVKLTSGFSQTISLGESETLTDGTFTLPPRWILDMPFGFANGQYVIEVLKPGWLFLDGDAYRANATRLVNIDGADVALDPFLGERGITIVEAKTAYEITPHFLHGIGLNEPITVIVDWGSHLPGKLRFTSTHAGMAPYEFSGTANATEDTVHTYRLEIDVGRGIGAGGHLSVAAVSSDGQESTPTEIPLEIMPQPFDLILYPVAIDQNPATRRGGPKYDFSMPYMLAVPEPLGSGTIPEDFPVFGGLKLKVIFEVDLKFTIQGPELKYRSYTGGLNLGQSAGFFNKTTFAAEGKVVASNGALYQGGIWKWDWALNGLVQGQASIERRTLILLPPPLAPLSVLTLGLYGEVGIAGQLSFQLKRSDAFYVPNPHENLLGTVESGLKLELAAGYGFRSASLYVEVRGSATGSAVYALKPLEFQNYDLKADVCINAQAFIFKLSDDWCLKWPGNERTMDGPASGLRRGDSPLRLIDRSYLETGTLSMGSVRASRIGLAGGPQSTTILEEHGFPYGTPELHSVGTNLLAVWIADLPYRSSINRTALMSAWFDGTSWSEPTIVDEDGTADFSPKILVLPSGAAVAVWENVAQALPETADLSALLAALEIKAAWWDPQERTWLPAASLTSNSVLDSSPRVTGDSADTITVVWHQNDSNDLLGSQDHPNQVAGARWTGTAWSHFDQPALVPMPIVQHDAVIVGDTVVNVFSALRESGEGSSLYRLDYRSGSWSPLQQLTADPLSDLAPRLITTTADAPLLFWLRDGVLHSSKLDPIDPQPVPATPENTVRTSWFQVGGTSDGHLALLWSGQGTDGPELYGSIYDPQTDQWALGVQLTHDPHLERGPSVAFWGAEALISMYNRVEPILEGQSGEPRASLAVVRTSLQQTVELRATAPRSGENQPGKVLLPAVVSNHGLMPTPDLTLIWTEVGAVPQEVGRTYLGSLRGGETLDAHLAADVPTTQGRTQWTVQIVNSVGIVDPALTNQIGLYSWGGPDLIVEYLATSLASHEALIVVGSIANRGTEAAGSFDVVISGGSSGAGGAVLEQRRVPGLQAGSRLILEFALSRDQWVETSDVMVRIDSDQFASTSIEDLSKRIGLPDYTIGPQFRDIVQLSSDILEFRLNTIPKVLYTLESSSNLVDWVTVQTITAITSSQVFQVHRDPREVRRFFRARADR